VSAIGVHTGAARLRLSAQPQYADPQVIESLTAAEASSRSAMLDLRRVLDVLHKTSDPTSQIGLADLDELLAGVRRSGLSVGLRATGQPRRLPGSVDVALYRVAQEMLTNALRYGDGSPVEVRLDYGESRVALSVRNRIGETPEADERPSTGRGLAGIHSRVSLFGGSLSYGPTADGTTWESRVDVSVDTPLSAGSLS
jgi:signal transduction histidine kinase